MQNEKSYKIRLDYYNGIISENDLSQLSNSMKTKLDATISTVESIEITSIIKSGEIKSLMYQYGASLGLYIDMDSHFASVLIHEEKFKLDFDKLYSYKGYKMIQKLSNSLLANLSPKYIGLQYPKEKVINEVTWDIKCSFKSKNGDEDNPEVKVQFKKSESKW
jgi:hypothetical protein